jgi:hypothetical protein
MNPIIAPLWATTFALHPETEMTTRRRLAAWLALAALATAPHAQADLYGPGPSDPINFFGGVFNVPTDAVPATISGVQQLNLFDGGVLPSFFDSSGELNVYGGSGGDGIIIQRLGEANIFAGTFGNRFRTSGETTITDGTFGDDFQMGIIGLNTGTGTTIGETRFSGGTIGNDASVTGAVFRMSGGQVGDLFIANPLSRVYISGGTIGDAFDAKLDSEVNISGGVVGQSFEAEPGSIVTISGGTIGDDFDATDSVVTISGGDFGQRFRARVDSVIDIRGGTFGSNFQAFAGSDINLRGTEFYIDGQAVTGLTAYDPFTVTDRDVTLSGVLTDGSAFSFDLNPGGAFGVADRFDPGATLKITFDPFDAIFNVPQDAAPTSIGHREQLNLFDGGNLGFFLAQTGSELNIEGGTATTVLTQGRANISGGTMGTFIASADSEVNITGGTFEVHLRADAGSEINITGGTFDEIRASAGSEINILVDAFTLDGLAVPGLTPGQSYTVTERDITLAGTYIDGSAFAIDLDSATFKSDATLTVTLIPEPSSLALLSLIGLATLTRRRRDR